MKLYLYVGYVTCDSELDRINHEIKEFDFTNEESKKELEKEWLEHNERVKNKDYINCQFRLFQGLELEIVEKQVKIVEQYELKVKDEVQ